MTASMGPASRWISGPPVLGPSPLAADAASSSTWVDNACMDQLSLGVLATSRKENESRLPLHPRHLDQIDADLRARIYLEQGYGEKFGYPDEALAPLVAGIDSAEAIFAERDVVLLPKPTLADAQRLSRGQVLWGWPHAVQDTELTQVAIDNKLTLIAWEAMNIWKASGEFSLHVFHMNNELAGYCSVLHAMTLIGSTGTYGRQLNAAVIGFGNTARGAINALQALGIHDVTVLTMREVAAVASPIPTVVLEHLDRDVADSSRTFIETTGGDISAAQYLSKFDIVVNCVLQDTDAPMMFVTNEDLALFSTGTLFVDVSCDLGMGFEFARPTTFEDPTFDVGHGMSYYAVDHSPTYLWNSATWDISESLLPYLRSVMSGPTAWEADATISRAIEIRDGVIANPKILSFQNRVEVYPHARR